MYLKSWLTCHLGVIFGALKENRPILEILLSREKLEKDMSLFFVSELNSMGSGLSFNANFIFLGQKMRKLKIS